MSNNTPLAPAVAANRWDLLARLWPACLTLAIAITVVLWLWQAIANEDERNARQQFERLTADVESRIRNRLAAYEQVLRGLTGHLSTQPDATRAAWSAHIKTLQLDKYYPGVQAVNHIRWVKAPELAAYVKRVRAEGFPNFQVMPAGEREFYAPAHFIEPFFERNLRAFGYDLYAEPVRRAALDAARSDGQTHITGKITLMQEIGKDAQPSFLMVVPVYETGIALDTPAQRHAALRGFVTGVFRMNDLMARIVEPGRDIGLAIHAGTAINADSLMYASDSQAAQITQAVDSLNRHKAVSVYGQQWTIRVSVPPRATTAEWARGQLVLAGGLFISVLLFLLVAALLLTRERALAVTTDMTQALRSSEERHELVLAGSSQGIWEHQFSGEGQDYYSNRFKELLGLNAGGAAMSRTQIQGLLHAGDRSRVRSALIAHLKHRDPFNLEFRVRHSDGDYRWFHATAQSLRDASGRVIRLAGSLTDVNARRLSEESLRLSEERLLLALNSASLFLFDWRVLNDALYLSEQWSTMVGLRREPMTITSQQARAVVHPMDAQELHARTVDALKGVTPVYRAEFRMHGSGSVWRWIHVEGVVIERDAHGAGIRLIGVASDITERKESERAKAEFLSTVSHELRTPLTAIRGTLALASQGLLDTQEAESRQMIEIAHQNAQRLARLVDDILDLERMDAGRLEYVRKSQRLTPVVEQAIALITPYSDPLNVRFALEATANPLVYVDEGRLIQALTNLLSNAAKFTPEGSQVTVSLRSSGEDIQEGCVRIVVIDHGPGVPAEHLPRLFQRFEQLNTQSRVKGGAGLGLSITRRLIEAMDGKVGYISPKNGGAAFYIDLPVTREAPATAL